MTPTPPRIEPDATSGVRTELVDQSRARGWAHRDRGRVDVFERDASRVRIVWGARASVTGGSLYQDDGLLAHTRELAKVRGWLAG